MRGSGGRGRSVRTTWNPRWAGILGRRQRAAAANVRGSSTGDRMVASDQNVSLDYRAWDEFAREPVEVFLRPTRAEFQTDDGVTVVIEGFDPFFDPACTTPVGESDRTFSKGQVFYCRLLGGSRHAAALQEAGFDVGQRVAISPERDNPSQVNAVAISASEARPPVAGYLPTELARDVAAFDRFVGTGAVIIQTTARDGERTGVRLLGSLDRRLSLQLV